jgi:hypothetical protein
MKRYYTQSSKFSATKAQIAYLRAVHQGLPIRTNRATANRCFRFLSFEGGIHVKPEVVAAFNLGAAK